MEKYLVLAFSHFDTGGLQTLMIRISEWSSKNGLQAVILYRTSDSYMSSLCKEKNLDAKAIFEKEKIKKYLDSDKFYGHSTLLMTFELEDFILFETVRKELINKRDVRHLLYCVSVGGTIFSKNIKGMLGCISYRIYKNIIKRYYENRQLIFMDRDTLEAATDYYHLNRSNQNENIFLLPMFISEEPEIPDGFRTQPKKILTVTRAVFPYKGYVIGLIDDFLKLCRYDPDISLAIISFGKDLEQIENKIKAVPKEIKSKIQLIPGMSLAEIQKELKNTYVYIGMGTTVLDAAAEGVPSVVSIHTTMKNECVGLFSQNPSVTGRRGPGNSGYETLKSVLQLNYEKYCELRRNTYMSYKNNYDINKFMKRIFERYDLMEGYELKSYEVLFHKLLLWLRWLKRKIN